MKINMLLRAAEERAMPSGSHHSMSPDLIYGVNTCFAIDDFSSRPRPSCLDADGAV